MFDVPPSDKLEQNWTLDAPIESRDWHIGLIVGPSGSGKTLIARNLFGDLVDVEKSWNAPSVIDDIADSTPIKQIVDSFSAVGFNTIPSWLKPYRVLSNGEQFRADLARRMLESEDLVVVDEFTSVVDRQVAKIASHAVQKHIRREGKRRFVAVSCHRDIVDWLRPDWIIDPSAMSFDWRSVQPRPRIECEVRRVDIKEWERFSRFHYMSAGLSRAAQCFGIFANGTLAAFAGVLHFAHPKVRNIKRLSRLVTLPDFQGVGLAFALTDAVASAYRAAGYRFRTYPAHPSLIRSFDRSKIWSLQRRPGQGAKTQKSSKTSTIKNWEVGYRPCAVFEFIGEASETARQTLSVNMFK